MKLSMLALFGLTILAFSGAVPTRRGRKFTSGNSGTSGRGVGDDTAVDTESKIQSGNSENGGAFAETRGLGASRGRGESSLDLESWAGFDGAQTGGAGGGGRAIGDDTKVETDSEVLIGEDSVGIAKSGSRGGARGAGETAIDLESFGSLDGWSSGGAGAGGRAVGDESEIDSESSVNSEFGRGTLSRSGSSGSAFRNGGVASLDLENFATVDETNTEGRASVKSIGNKVSGRSGSNSLHGADGTIEAGSESEGASEASGRGGIRARAQVNDNGFEVSAGAEGRGEGDLVLTGGSSKTGLTNTQAAGESGSFAKSSGRGHSFAESAATLNIGEGKPSAEPVQPANQPEGPPPEPVQPPANQPEVPLPVPEVPLDGPVEAQ